MREVLQTDNPQVDTIINYMLAKRGKMLRPRLLYLAASLYPHDTVIVQDMAVAVEMIHMASLVHDDVIDNATSRRGRESLNFLWGNQASVLAGDYLFASAFNLINQHGLQEIMDNITTTIQTMCSGEIIQLAMMHNYEISENEYYDKTFRKTACLFASSCKVGVLASSAPREHIEILEKFGLYLGYAYQIIDDLLDFVSDASLLGKPVGNDLSQGNITLPIILGLKHSFIGRQLKQLLKEETPFAEKMPQILHMLASSGVLEECLKSAQAFFQQGLEMLKRIPISTARDELENISITLTQEYYKTLSCNVAYNNWGLQNGNA